MSGETSARQRQAASKHIQIGETSMLVQGLDELDKYFNGLHDNYEQEFYRLCQLILHPTDVCVDIGTNIGIKSLLLAQLVKQGCVLAVEPGQHVVELLILNVMTNHLDNVVIEASAVGDEDGLGSFTENSAYRHLSSQGDAVTVKRLETIVNSRNLDRVDFVKLDVEGHELKILRDSTDLLRRNRSMVLLGSGLNVQARR